MSGTGLQFETAELDRLTKRLSELPRKLDLQVGLLDAVGNEVVSQTQRRLLNEKTSPAGAAWPEWSDAYARTRHGGHSLLMGEGNLEESITHNVGLDYVEVGTNLIYGAIHQFGGAEVGSGIPAREYLGLSPANLDELAGVIDAFIDARLRAA